MVEAVTLPVLGVVVEMIVVGAVVGTGAVGASVAMTLATPVGAVIVLVRSS